MGKNRQHSSPNSSGNDKKSSIDILIAKYGLAGIIASAFLGLVGVSLTAYFSYLAIKTQVEAPIRATQTAEASLKLVPTSTVTSPLANPTSTATLPPILAAVLPTGTSTTTPVYSPSHVTLTPTLTASPLSPIQPVMQPITVANAGSVTQVRWVKIFGSPVNLDISPDGKTLAIATNFDIQIYDPGNLDAPLFNLEGHKTLSRVKFNPDGQILASAGSSFDNTIRLWDMAKGGVELAVLTGHTEAIYSIDFSTDGSLLASGSRDNSLRVWDVKTGKELFFSLNHNREVHSVAFSPDGATLASGGADGKIRLWDVQTKQEKKVLDGHTIQVDCLAFSPDGKLLASAGQYDTEIRLWDTQTWQPMNILRGHVDSDGGYGVFSLAFNHQGTLLASGGADKSVRLWDVNPLSPSFSKELVKLLRHSDWVDSLVFSPDGAALISASERDGTIRIWAVGP